MNYSNKTLPELKQFLKDKRLSTVGKKADLVKRLEDYDAAQLAERNRFKVFIKTMMGSYYTIYIDPSATVMELKQKIDEKLGIAPNNQVLLMPDESDGGLGFLSFPSGLTNKKITRDNETLVSLGITNESTIYLQMKLL